MNEESRSRELVNGPEMDPEPISLALALLSAVIAGSGLLINIARHRKESRNDRKLARRILSQADRALTQLFDEYRHLFRVYEEYDVLGASMIPGEIALNGDREFKRHVSKLREGIVKSGEDLESSLDELSEILDEDSQGYILTMAADLRKFFDNARKADTLLEFMLGVLLMIDRVAAALTRIGSQWDFRLTLTQESIGQLVRDLGTRVERQTPVYG